MATPDFEAAILDLLATLLPAEIVTSGAGRTAMAGPMRNFDEVPVDMVFVQASGGAPDWTNDGARPTVSVTVLTRGDRRRYEATRALALKIHDALHLCGRRVAGGATIVDVRSMSSIPIYLGPGESDEELFVSTFNVISEVLS